jgi:hypothetical protein
LSLAKLSAISVALPCIVAGVTFYWQNKTLRKLSVFIFATLSLEMAAIACSYYHQNNMWIFHIYTLLEVVFAALIYHDILNDWKRKLVIALLIVFLVFSLLNIIFFERLEEFNTNQRFLGGITIIIYSLIYFVQIFKEANIDRIERHAYFWLNSSYLIYFAGTLFLFILTKNILAVEASNYWNLHSVLNILLNLGYTITLWMGARKLI